MTAKLDYIWKLREVMATRGLFQTTHLRPRLAERGIHLSDSQVYRLVTDKPERLNLKVLMALLDILGCRIDDLIQPVAVPAAKTKKKTAGQGSARSPESAPSGPGGRGSFPVPRRDRPRPCRGQRIPQRARRGYRRHRRSRRAGPRPGRHRGRGRAGRSVPGSATTSRRCADR